MLISLKTWKLHIKNMIFYVVFKLDESLKWADAETFD